MRSIVCGIALSATSILVPALGIAVTRMGYVQRRLTHPPIVTDAREIVVEGKPGAVCC